jgi:fucose permease
MRELIRTNAGLLLAGLATFVLMGAGQSLYGPALPAFARDLRLTEATAGLLVSAHWVGCALGVAGMYVAGHRVTPRVALALMAAGAGLLALGAGWWMTLAGAVVFGGGYGSSTVVFNPRILRAFGDRGTSMLSLLNAAFGIGAIAAPLVFVRMGSVPATGFALVAGLGALVWLGAGPAGRSGAHEGPRGPRAPFRPPFGFLLFAVVGIGIEACLIGLGPTALIAAGTDEVRAAELLSAFFVAFLGARVILVFAAHLVSPFALYGGAMAACAGLAVLAAVISPGIFFVAMGLCAGVFFPGFYVAASRKMGDDPRTAPTIIAAGLVGGIAAPIMLGAMMGGLGGRGFFWIIAGAALVAAVAAAVVGRRMPH